MVCMSPLAMIMLEQLAAARRIVEDGHDVVPAWRITTPEGSYLVLTPFETDKQEQQERALRLISRFMAWKLATSFVLTVETWLGPAVLLDLSVAAETHVFTGRALDAVGRRMFDPLQNRPSLECRLPAQRSGSNLAVDGRGA